MNAMRHECISAPFSGVYDEDSPAVLEVEATSKNVETIDPRNRLGIPDMCTACGVIANSDNACSSRILATLSFASNRAPAPIR